MVTWPREYGGRGLNLIQWLIFEEEYYRAGAPGLYWSRIWALFTLLRWTREQGASL